MPYRCGDRVFGTLEEMLEDSRSRLSWWERLVYATWYPARRRFTGARLAVYHAHQRVVRGWDDSAVWSVDSHLSRSLGQQLVVMSEIAHGHPVDYPFDRWVADLKTHGAALLTYQREHYDTHDQEAWDALYGPAQDALRWVADNLASLWD